MDNIPKQSRRSRHAEPLEADNMQAAAQRLGCSVPDLKRAKRAGCAGFVHGRVHLEKVKAWLVANPPSDDDMSEDALRKRKLLAQCKKLEREDEIAAGQWTHNDEVARVSVAWAAQVRAELMALKSEAPTWAGLSPAELQDKADQFIVMALGRLQSFHAPIQNQDSK